MGNFSRFFIERPIFASVLAIVITLAGVIAGFNLPIAQYPEISPPTVTISTSYPGASAETIAQTVAAPIEEQLSGTEGMVYFTSSAGSDGNLSITCTFEVSTDIDRAVFQVNNRVGIALPRLPDEVRRSGILVQKRSPDILLVSLGTGEVKTPIHYQRARVWGLIGWVRPLIGIFMDGVAATVEGVAGEWRVDPEALDGDFEGRTALLSPFDRLVYDRVRAQELFDFEYVLEMYKPTAKRRWGYFALPVLHGDRLVGKVDATADRKRSVLEVHAIHEDIKFTRAIAEAVQAEIEALASWLGLETVALK